MDVTFSSVLRLYEQGCSQREITRRLKISHTKVCKILVTAGVIKTEESEMFSSGLSIEEIADKLGKSEKSVITRIPYQKCMYNAEYPTMNALKIRTSREKKSKSPSGGGEWTGCNLINHPRSKSGDFFMPLAPIE